ncbi:MAG: glycosyl hydrolase 2 galactose-binding domain-containing protein [Gaiellaceae bacterium]
MNWQSASVAAGAFAGVPPLESAEWRPVEPPVHGSDDEDHWFRTALTVDAPATLLRLGGLATVCDVFLDGEHVLRSESMFVEHELSVAEGRHELALCARALTPLLAERRKPRARWRTRVVADGNLRWLRTTLLGRAPGFAPGPPVVGPWRPVELVDPRTPRLDVRTALDGEDGIVEIRCAEKAGPLEVTIGAIVARLPAGGGSVRVPRPDLWWPHTHGRPTLHAVEVRAAGREIRRRVGFRQLVSVADPEVEGLDLHVNGVPVFARGAVWVPPPRDEVRATLERARDAGLNLVRVVGTTFYESSDFHDACDELGLLVWQDLMFANMDYPFVDGAFRTLAEREVRQALREVSGRPSLAVVCGNSEIEQQVAMLGLPPDLGRDEFFASTVPELAHAAGIDAPYVSSAPTGGTFAFRTDRGVANYFGVGAYLRPLDDVRRAEVRFASECLAFANVPDDEPSDRAEGVMRDVGADWDFADVRDHYLQALRGVGPGDDAYWVESRHITGEVMAAVFGEWRRAASPCAGGIVLWLRDLAPGAGWGVLDHRGRPKLVWHYLRRALSPVAVWFVNEGLNGLAVHAANDTGATVTATLRLALYRDEEILVGEASEPLELAAHSSVAHDAEALLGHFVDIGYVYRFGEAQHDTVVATLEDGAHVLSQAFFHPLSGLRRMRDVGLSAAARRRGDGGVDVSLSSVRVVRGVRVRAPGLEALDDGFELEPGRERTIVLRPVGLHTHAATHVVVDALDLAEPLEVELR